MAYTNKTNLAKLLKVLGRNKEMFAIEVGCKGFQGEKVTSDPSFADLATFLVERPLKARQMFFFLKKASTDSKFDALAQALWNVKGAGEAVIGQWTLTPDKNGSVTVAHPKGKFQVEYSTDLRVGLIVLEQGQAQAKQLEFVTLPAGVRSHLLLMFPPLQELREAASRKRR